MNGEFYSTTTIYGYVKKEAVLVSYKSLMAILNSKLCWWYLMNTGTVLANGYFRYKPNYINPFPFPIITKEASETLNKLVNEIYTSRQNKANSNVPQLEKKIDFIVYKLYNLTLEEIELINNK
ncbi:TaqI-like C-terminal specificity domain-containing protein [Pedobacter frigidisoli]|uniref:TaqI-like C-terminal specificity domain-containing protein n=1 Tax=Pedobacter frigidisoli TaxID=2530455 RepID=UPI001CED4E61|nr:TaqI-like C-terminal specificity domain-containing protein [Pedobacter frigidisoli]